LARRSAAFLRLTLLRARRLAFQDLPYEEAEEVRAHIEEEGALTERYALMCALSAGIATLGLLQSSSAVVIGAMLVSPLMGPIAALGFGLASLESDRIFRAARAVGIGVAVGIFVGMTITWLSPIRNATPEIVARTAPTLLDLAIALLSGLAGGYATVHRRGETAIGVAIATALMPPLATLGYSIAVWRLDFVFGALLLFLTNLAAISFAFALALRPNAAAPYVNLGSTLVRHGRVAEAIRHWERAVALEPALPMAHYNLGAAYLNAGDVARALGYACDAARLAPEGAFEAWLFGEALLASGRFAEARPELVRAMELGGDDATRRTDIARRLARCDGLLEIERRLSAQESPVDAADALRYAEVHRLGRRYAAAARCYAEAFAAAPHQAENMESHVRYDAACAAALAGGTDLSDDGGARVRAQAREWLVSDLRVWHDAVRRGGDDRGAADATLAHWLTDADLAGVRDAAALARLPAAEREEWRAFWASVESVRAAAR
jgi:uncharacterized hydrophobic protein (TIGR00271 family)